MLHIFCGDMEGVAYGPSWFKYSYEAEWFEDPFVQKMIRTVDRSEYQTGSVIISPVLGAIPPEKLSGGLQTLIMIYEMPDKIFDATSCGPNCAEMLLEIGNRRDVTVNLRYLMPMDGCEPFQIEIVNANKIVSSAEDYTLTALDYLD